MDRRVYLGKIAMLALLAAVLGGCTGSTDGGGEPDRADQFVATDDTVGSISLEVFTNPLAVGDTSKFRVAVVDAQGAPVPQARIACDSEKNIAIVEPTTGVEMTDAWGHMSGVIGCEAPGSFQLACRLPIGGNRRAFVTVACQGQVPAGFTGWPGAAGGGLGGGVDTSGQDDAAGLGVRLTGISFNDGPNTDTISIDVVRDTCNATTTPPVYEVFTDTIANFTVANDTNSLARFTAYQYVVANYDGAGHSFTSGKLSLIGEVAVSPNGGEETFSAVFMDAYNGGKRYYGRADTIQPAAYGFKNVRISLYGIDASGNPVEITGGVAVSIGDFNNCERPTS